MHGSSPPSVSVLLEKAANGDETAKSEFFAAAYPELKRIAAHHLRSWHANKVSLACTEVVHEAWLRLVDLPNATAKGRSYFYTCFATACRRLMVDHWREKTADKRGGGAGRVSLTPDLPAPEKGRFEFDVIDLSEALDALAKTDARAASVVELQLFGGLSQKECAVVLDVSERTVQGDYMYAKAWLARELRA